MSTNETIALVYCGVAVVSAAILLFNARTVSAITPRFSIGRYVYLAFLFAGLSAVFDCAYILREMEVVSFSQGSSYVLTLMYVICLSLCGSCWVIYSEKKQNSWFVKTKKRFLLYSLPLGLLLLAVLSSPLTHWYFYFEDNHYQRGSLFLILSSLLNLYVIQTGVSALVRSFKKENYVDRKEFRRLFAFSVVYILIQLVQLLLPTVFPYRSVGTMLFFDVFLIQNMMEKIGRDPLTRINNRFAAERQLGAMMNSRDTFELVMLDVDKFKSINDQYGHQEGDRALSCVSSALVASVERSCFVARMGGDEFILINGDATCSIANIERRINENIEALLEQKSRKYKLTVSVGYAQKDESIQSIPDLIQLADSKLYARKAQKNGV